MLYVVDQSDKATQFCSTGEKVFVNNVASGKPHNTKDTKGIIILFNTSIRIQLLAHETDSSVFTSNT